MHMMVQGRPRPRKTLVAFEAVMLRRAASAVWPFLAATMLHQISGIDVPNESMVSASTVVRICRTQAAVLTTEYVSKDRKNIIIMPQAKVTHP